MWGVVYMCVKGIDFSVSSIYPLEFWLGYFLYSSISTWRHPINNQIWLCVVLMVKPTDDHSECCVRRVPTSLPCTLRSPIVDLERICTLVVRCKGLMFSSSPILLQWQSEAVAVRGRCLDCLIPLSLPYFCLCIVELDIVLNLHILLPLDVKNQQLIENTGFKHWNELNVIQT